MKYSFKNDYSEGCHPSIIKAFEKNNFTQFDGYGFDDLTKYAAGVLKQKCNHIDAGVFFVSGGTQANLVVISALTKDYEAVVSADSGHINIHEAGAIEAVGRKIISIPTQNGKITSSDITDILKSHNDPPHTVKPGLVYISNSTELGTVYTKSELTALSGVCRQNDLRLFLDGARLGSALSSDCSDLTLADVAELTDAFYIGGTKNGMLFGEAIVISNSNYVDDFQYYLKQRGALLAKARVVALQFLELFENDLYFEIAHYANSAAKIISDAVLEHGYSLFTETQSNQVFPVFPNSIIRALQEKYDFYLWKSIGDDMSVVRLVTSWATSAEVVNEFCEFLNLLKV